MTYQTTLSNQSNITSFGNYKTSTLLKWLVVLFVVPNVLSSLFVGLLTGFYGTAEYTQSISGLSIHSILAGLFSVPIILHVRKICPGVFCLNRISTNSSLQFLFFGLLLSLSLSLAGYLLGMEPPQFLQGLNDDWVTLGLGFIAICLAAPVIEEILFRGLLFAALQRMGLHSVIVVLVSSLIFASIHWNYDLDGLALVFVLSVFLGYARLKTQNILLCIAIHALHNFYSFSAYVLLN